MALKALKPTSLSFGFTPNDLAPMLQMQRIANEENILQNYNSQLLLNESIMRRQHDSEMASIRAAEFGEKTRPLDNKGEKESATSYTITYFNPELRKSEVLEAKSPIRIKDPVLRSVEEAVASGSALPLYGFFASPLIRTEVLPWKLEEILAQREYGTPPPPPSGAAVTPVRIVVQTEKEREAERRRADWVKEALDEFVLRKERSEQAIGTELLILEDAVKALRAGEEIDKVIERLPPLSRARYILALRKKGLSRQAIISLLAKDIAFLGGLRKKLELFSLEDLVSMYLALRKLQKG